MKSAVQYTKKKPVPDSEMRDGGADLGVIYPKEKLKSPALVLLSCRQQEIQLRVTLRKA